jgi:hypothetical protein
MKSGRSDLRKSRVVKIGLERVRRDESILEERLPSKKKLDKLQGNLLNSSQY